MKNAFPIVLVALFGVGLWLNNGGNLPAIDWLKPDPSPVVAPVSEPDAEAKQAVAGVTAVLNGHAAEAAKLQGYFASLAVVAEKHPDKFATAGQLRQHHATATEMYFPFVAGPGAVPGLQNALDSAMASLLGLDNATLDTAKVKRAIDALTWACGEAS